MIPAIRLIRIYQKWISPAFPARCKYYPTCSAYAVLALRSKGLIIGSVLAAWRLVRCNPWSMGGIDYPPGGKELIGIDQKNGRKVSK